MGLFRLEGHLLLQDPAGQVIPGGPLALDILLPDGFSTFRHWPSEAGIDLPSFTLSLGGEAIPPGTEVSVEDAGHGGGTTRLLQLRFIDGAEALFRLSGAALPPLDTVEATAAFAEGAARSDAPPGVADLSSFLAGPEADWPSDAFARRLDGGPGADLLLGGSGADALAGGAGDDLLMGEGDDDLLDGGEGDDILIGGPGHDILSGGVGFDTVRYDEDHLASGVRGILADLGAGTIIDGFGGSDRVTGIEAVRATPFADEMIAGLQAVHFVAGAGDDRLVGGPGADRLQGGDGADTINGGDGDDIIHGGDSAADLRDVVYAGAGADFVDGGHGNDLLYGMEGDDTIEGGFGADTIAGQTGADSLSGGPLSDELFGGNGDDFLNGGFGSDRLNGGAGADRFFHLGVADHGSDWIQDFRHAEGDRLVFGGSASAAASAFQVNFGRTPGAGNDAIDEAFVIDRASGHILWALIDGAAEEAILLQVAGGGLYDLLG